MTRVDFLRRADVMKMTIWQTPAGIVDEGGVVLQSWLNFGVTLLGPPANGIMHVRRIAACSLLHRAPGWHPPVPQASGCPHAGSRTGVLLMTGCCGRHVRSLPGGRECCEQAREPALHPCRCEQRRLSHADMTRVVLSLSSCCCAEMCAPPTGRLPWQLRPGKLRDEWFLGHAIPRQPVWHAGRPGQREVQPGSGVCFPGFCTRVLPMRGSRAEPYLLRCPACLHLVSLSISMQNGWQLIAAALVFDPPLGMDASKSVLCKRGRMAPLTQDVICRIGGVY